AVLTYSNAVHLVFLCVVRKRGTFIDRYQHAVKAYIWSYALIAGMLTLARVAYTWRHRTTDLRAAWWKRVELASAVTLLRAWTWECSHLHMVE
ncbi:MAG TPA: hypothetical protein VFE12_08595, partial [Acetobacteraceae bacterium]|nr:hypothetical protein [Acetobacteraceae bacterium]